MAENKEETGITYVQVRLPAELSKTLKADAARSNRKLPSEILHRLKRPAGEADALLFGWVDAERNKSLGIALAILAGRLEVAGPMTDDRVQDRANVLGMLKLAIGEVLDRLGADEGSLSADEKSFAALKAREFANELQRPERHPQGIGPRPDLDILARVAGAEPIGTRRKAGG